jgi:hypothetical protein
MTFSSGLIITLIMEAVSTYEKSINFSKTKQRNTPEESSSVLQRLNVCHLSKNSVYIGKDTERKLVTKIVGGARG